MMRALPPLTSLIPLLLACAGPHPAPTPPADPRRVRLEMTGQLARQADWPRAFAAADALVREDPSDAGARLLRGTALRHQDLLTEAEADLRAVLAREPAPAAAHAELALLLERSGRREEALVHHREALQRAPEEPRYLNALGFALVIRGQPAEAVPLLERALRVEPGNRRYRNNLGFACAATGDFARSAQEFGRAGTPAQARNNLGLAYERAGDLEHAYQLYLEAWRMHPEPRFRGNLTSVARVLGREAEADLAAGGDPEKGGL